MPTGYTADLVDGKELTFEEFAKKCMRAFGATIHMRDKPIDAEYEPNEPSDYHMEKIEKCRKELSELNNISDDELKEAELKRLKESIHDERQRILKKKEIFVRLDNMLKEVKKWEAPTDEHEDFKKFMIDQIEKTIEWDCNISYNQETIQRYENRIKNIDELNLREEKEEMIEDSIRYHQENYKEELLRCKNRNEWVELLLNSFD